MQADIRHEDLCKNYTNRLQEKNVKRISWLLLKGTVTVKVNNIKATSTFLISSSTENQTAPVTGHSLASDVSFRFTPVILLPNFPESF